MSFSPRLQILALIFSLPHAHNKMLFSGTYYISHQPRTHSGKLSLYTFGILLRTFFTTHKAIFVGDACQALAPTRVGILWAIFLSCMSWICVWPDLLCFNKQIFTAKFVVCSLLGICFCFDHSQVVLSYLLLFLFFIVILLSCVLVNLEN